MTSFSGAKSDFNLRVTPNPTVCHTFPREKKDKNDSWAKMRVKQNRRGFNRLPKEALSSQDAHLLIGQSHFKKIRLIKICGGFEKSCHN